MVRLTPEQMRWAERAPTILQPLVKQLHGPLIAAYAARVNLGDDLLAGDCQQGFPIVGVLPEIDSGSQPLKKVKPTTSLANLQAMRQTKNKDIIRSETVIEKLGPTDTWPAEEVTDVIVDRQRVEPGLAITLRDSELHTGRNIKQTKRSRISKV